MREKKRAYEIEVQVDPRLNFRKETLEKREVRQSWAVIGGNYDNSIPRVRSVVSAVVQAS